MTMVFKASKSERRTSHVSFLKYIKQLKYLAIAEWINKFSKSTM